ncbi:MAG: hypothetical protein LBL08_00875 [Candidatus Nomurabacteria bacterium]|jgi:hypothetical protein|nr:hypothetical protein [Candidatus Nomurabacteria bacterium]
MTNFIKFQNPDHPKCQNKNCYNSRQEAEKVKQEQELMDIKQELKLKIYRCANCGKFHLTRAKN